MMGIGFGLSPIFMLTSSEGSAPVLPWILEDGTWNDAKYWVDTALWIDELVWILSTGYWADTGNWVDSELWAD
jgi:hypothetical protein